MVTGFILQLVRVPWSLRYLYAAMMILSCSTFTSGINLCPVVSQSAGLSAWCSSPWHTGLCCSIFWKRTKLLRCAVTKMVSLLVWHRNVRSVGRSKNICRVFCWQGCVTSQLVVCRSTLSLPKHPVCSCLVTREGKRSELIAQSSWQMTYLLLGALISIRTTWTTRLEKCLWVDFAECL